MSKNLIARIAVAAVAIPAILWICYQGGIWLKGMVAFFSLVAAFEFLYNEKIKPTKVIYWLFLLILLLALNYWLRFIDAYMVNIYKLQIPIMFLLLAGMILAIGKETPAKLFEKYTRLLWGLLYVGLLYPYVARIGLMDYQSISGGDLLLFLFGVLWVGDTAAMFGGKAFGKHKLAPTVSPNKTIEGFVSGIVGAMIVGVIMYFWKLEPLGMYHVLFMALGCSIFGQLGDLVESMWKRSLNIKDSSAIIPGHGGILDRFDSLLFAAPFMWYYITYNFVFFAM